MQKLVASPRDAFAHWMLRVDNLLERSIGLCANDCDDWVWYQCFREGMHPLDAVREFRSDQFGLED